jgi:hypothetical protein
LRRALALAPAVLATALLAAPVVSGHQGNPNFRSIVDAVTPAVPGLKLQVLNDDDRFELTNRSGKTGEVVRWIGALRPDGKLTADAAPWGGGRRLRHPLPITRKTP